MRAHCLTATLLLLGFPTGIFAGENTPSPTNEKNGVEIARYDWTDAKRHREVPVKIYYPKTGSGPFPVIIFSHGLGGTREGYEYLGQYWAGHGFVSVHPQHSGSDDSVWRGKGPGAAAFDMQKAIFDPSNLIQRPLDIRFVIDQVTRLNKEDPAFKGRLDLDHIGMAGHSYGGYTTMAVAGWVLTEASGFAMTDPRVKAAIPMSAPIPVRKDRLDEAFGNIAIPCLHMTGTEDFVMLLKTKAEDRRLAFDHINKADQYLLIFQDGDHMVFAGMKDLMGRRPKDPVFHELILKSTTAFWNAYLNGDASEKAWLADGDFKKALGANGTFEKKIPGKVDANPSQRR